MRAHRRQEMDVRARHAAVQDVTADRHGQPGDVAAPAADRQRVQQRLRRMLVAAVAGVDDRAVDLFGQQLDRAALGVAHDQDVGVHGVQRHRRVDQRLALLDRRVRDRHVDDIGAEPLAGQLERGARARRAFEEQVDLGAPAQHGGLLVRAAIERDVAIREVEQQGDFVGRQPLDAEKMGVRKFDDRRCGSH